MLCVCVCDRERVLGKRREKEKEREREKNKHEKEVKIGRKMVLLAFVLNIFLKSVLCWKTILALIFKNV